MHGHSPPQFEVENLDSPSAAQGSGRAKPTAAAEPQTTRKVAMLASKRTNTLMGVRVVGCGSYVPENVVTNEDLKRTRGFDPDWIEQRTGILARRHAAPHQATSDLCCEAALRAIRDAQIDASEIDLVVLGTFTPDHACPSTACLVQDRLSLDAPAMDVQAACSGFMYALITAAQYVATGNSRLALVLGGDTNSRIIDPNDRSIAPLFGDGAGAVLLTRGGKDQGLVCYQTGADGSGGPLLEAPSSGTRNPISVENVLAGQHFLQMDGRNVFKWAVRVVTETIELMFEKTGYTAEDVSLFVLHQANVRILDHAMQHLGVPREKVFNNLDKYGNTSGGSIPIVLDEARRAGKIRPGDLILMSGFGAGLTWGTSLFRW